MEITLKDLGEKVAERGTGVLSRFLKRQVRVETTSVFVKNMYEIMLRFNRILELEVASVTLPVTGEIKGSALFIVSKSEALRLCDELMQRPLGETKEFSAMDMSAFQETGNIIAGNCLTVIADMLQIQCIEGPPVYCCDMYGSILQQTVTDNMADFRDALLIEVDLLIHELRTSGVFIFLFDHKSCQQLLDLASSQAQ